jgi:hypothetical protein
MAKLRKIYYDKTTGNVIYACSFNEEYIDTTFDHDYETIKELHARTKESIGLIRLENGEYEEDFRQCNGYRVNPETLELEFSYPDPNATEPQESVFVKPLTEQIEELRQENITTLLALTEVYEMIIGGGGA